MSVAVQELDTPNHYAKVSANTFEDLVELSSALGYLLTHVPEELDEQKRTQAQALRDEVIDHVTLTLDGELQADTVHTYVVEEGKLVRDALAAAKQSLEVQAEQREPDPEFAWLHDPNTTRSVNTVPLKIDTTYQIFKD
jgi:hypothetical protein